MGLLGWLFGKRANRGAAVPQHLVLVNFQYGSTDLSRMLAAETELERVIEAAGAGEFDGNEIAVDGSDGSFYMYGPDADTLFAAVRPTLESIDFMKGAKVLLQYGPPNDGVRTREVILGS